MFDNHIDHLTFETEYMDVESVEKNLVVLTSKSPAYQDDYHSFALSVSGRHARPLAATVAVFDYHPGNVTCWSMENGKFDFSNNFSSLLAIFDTDMMSTTTSTAIPTTTANQLLTTTAVASTTTAPSTYGFDEKVCQVEANIESVGYNIAEITDDGWKFSLVIDHGLNLQGPFSALVIFDDNVDLYDEFTELMSDDVRIRLRRNNVAVLEGIVPQNMVGNTITVRSAMQPVSATVFLLKSAVLDQSEIDCFAEKFAFVTTNKEATTCSNLFSGSHVEFGADTIQYQAVSTESFNIEVNLRPRQRHYSEWGLVLVFDENIDLYDELIEMNSAHLAVKGRKGNVVFFDGRFELERNTPVSVLIQVRSKMGMMGATVAFIDANIDNELQKCLSDLFFLTMTPTQPPTQPPPITPAPDNEESDESTDDVVEGTCAAKVNFGSHIVETTITNNKAVYNVAVEDGEFTPDEWGLVVIFDEDTQVSSFNDTMVLIDQEQQFALFQGVGEAANNVLQFESQNPTGALVGYIDGFIDEKVLSCLKSMTGIEAARSSTTARSTTTTTTTTPSPQSTVSQQCVTYENEKWVSGSIKNAEWQQGNNYKFNRHVYIPLNGRTVTNWEILLEFSDPVFDLEVWTVKATKIDQEGRHWKFTSVDNQPKSVTEDPWVFNFLGQSAKPGSTLEVSFCVFD